MHLTFNNEIVGGIQQGGKVDFNLYEVAKVLGYAQPRTAAQNFMRSSKLFSAISESLRVDCEKADESVLFAFLLYSNAPRAIEFQSYVCTVILPLVRQVGVEALQELAVMKALSTNYYISLDELKALAPIEVVENVLEREGRYYQYGFFPPSHFGSPAKIAEILIDYGVFDSEGNPRPKFAESVKYSDKWVGHVYGKWYAYKPELVEAARVAYNMKQAEQSTKIFLNFPVNDLELS